MIKNIYKSESRIYIGTNSRVIKCYNNKQNEYNALKIFTEQNKNDFYNELKIINMFAPNIENINKFIEYFEFNNEYYIVYPYYELNLRSFLQSYKININMIKYILSEIIKPLKYIHNELDSFHGDIKTDNILVDPKNKKIKLIDFATVNKNDQIVGKHFGTLLFNAPEVILQSVITSKCDIWSFGCLMYEMLTNNILFDSVESDTNPSICVADNPQVRIVSTQNKDGCDKSKVRNALLNCAHHILQLKSIMKICGNINEEIVPQDIELPTKCINEIIYDKLCEFNIRDKNLANIIGATVVIDPSKRPSINDLDEMISSI